MATLIAIEKYKPKAIINQGIAGSHVDYIHRNDIVVGEKSVNVNSFITGIKNKDEGSNPFEWQFDNRSFEVTCNEELLKIAQKINNEKQNLFFGILGRGDIRTITNNEVTQKESDGATSTRSDLAKDANRMITKKHDSSPAKVSQEFVVEYVELLIKHIKNSTI